MVPGEAYAAAVGVTPRAIRSMIYTEGFRQSLQGHRAEDRYVRSFDGAPAHDALSRAQYADLKIWLPGDILTKVDRTSMAVSLEAREPLLDHRLVEFAARIPAGLRLRGGTGKWLMKRALESRLPKGSSIGAEGFVTRSALASRPLADQAARIAHGSRSPNSAGSIRRPSHVSPGSSSGQSDHGRLCGIADAGQIASALFVSARHPQDTKPRQKEAVGRA